MNTKKRVISLAWLMLLCMVLTACSASPAAQTGDAATPTQGAADQSGSTTTEPQESSVATFGATTDDMASAMTAALTDSDLPNAMDTEPTDKEMDDGTIAHSYAVTTGVQLVAYEDKTSSKLAQVMLYGDTGQISTADAKTFGGYFALVTGLFAKDATDLSGIDAAMDFTNNGVKDGTFAYYDGQVASFMYTVDGSSAMLIITPPSK